jgi:hypothetical protein
MLPGLARQKNSRMTGIKENQENARGRRKPCPQRMMKVAWAL